MNSDRLNDQLVEKKLKLVKSEMKELSYRECELITTGYEKDVLILDKKIVIAFFFDGLNLDDYCVQEKLICRLAEKIDAILPECLYISPTQNFVVEKYVPGYQITPQYLEQHLEEAQQIGREVGRFLRTLHKTSGQGLDLQTGFAKDVRNDMEVGVNAMESKLSQSEIEQVKEFLNSYYEILASVQTGIVHGDFHYDNILWDENGIRLGVIDFSEAAIEDPALDFMYMCYYPKEFRNAVFAEYGLEYTRLYERSQMYDRIYGLYDMIENIQGDPRKPDFQKGYNRFFGKRSNILF